jgi:hypothetical protein
LRTPWIRDASAPFLRRKLKARAAKKLRVTRAVAKNLSSQQVVRIAPPAAGARTAKIPPRRTNTFSEPNTPTEAARRNRPLGRTQLSVTSFCDATGIVGQSQRLYLNFGERFAPSKRLVDTVRRGTHEKSIDTLASE